MSNAKIGLVGLAVMGENLALNIERNGYPIAVWNRTTSKVDDFISRNPNAKGLVGTHSPQEFVDALESPKKIILLVKAGQPVDDMISQIKPYLSPGDILIDGGNSLFH
ncbi:MAG: NAD(P)-binding domain-containing protein, partial [Candidatus Omnitrophica bacterium]|nr:NAD(P)-binding domain-containing protein [Candidatus Omnitrophota bacterium]